MLDKDTLALASVGSIEPAVVARLAGLTVAELMARRGAEISAVIDEQRGGMLRKILLAALQKKNANLGTTAIRAAPEDWRRAFPEAKERRYFRGITIRMLVAVALDGADERNIQTCSALLELPDDDWHAACDNAGLHLCNSHRRRIPNDCRQQLIAHLRAILKDEKAHQGLRIVAGRALLRHLDPTGEAARA